MAIILKQLIKFSSVGIIINASGFIIYIFASNFLGINPPIAAILVGILIAPIGFSLQKKYSFQHTHKSGAMHIKYYLLYAFTILMNAFNIWLFSNHIGYSHEITAAFSIVFLALLSFLVQKFCIFKKV